MYPVYLQNLRYEKTNKYMFDYLKEIPLSLFVTCLSDITLMAYGVYINDIVIIVYGALNSGLVITAVVTIQFTAIESNKTVTVKLLPTPTKKKIPVKTSMFSK
jgi:hypothetical protein